MATTNVAVTKAWVRLVDDSVEAFCASSRFQQEIEYAATAADEDPTVAEGTALVRGDAATRASHPSGFVSARISPSSNLSTATIVLSQ
jgi:hypothetical protein